MKQEQSYSFIDTQDYDILMHKEVHFGGSFDIMLQYYEKEGKGAMLEFEIGRIRFLQQTENQLGSNLAEEILDEEQKQKIQEAKNKYFDLRKIYETSSSGMAGLIADLILTEDLEPLKEIQAIVSEGKGSIRPLLDLLGSLDFHDSLFPGYGFAPVLAVECLKQIKDPSTMQGLFDALQGADFLLEDTIFQAFVSIGEDAIAFLTKIAKQQPLNRDNLNAIIALSSFPPTESIAECCLEILKYPQAQEDIHFATYLVLGCEALVSSESQDQLISIVKKINDPDLTMEIKLLCKIWNKIGCCK